jgi:hypothetical protein
MMVAFVNVNINHYYLLGIKQPYGVARLPTNWLTEEEGSFLAFV